MPNNKPKRDSVPRQFHTIEQAARAARRDAEPRSSMLVQYYYEQAGNTLTVWFGNPRDEFISEEIVLMKDKQGQVIGFEKLNFLVPKPSHLQVAFETVAA